jgi:cytochrome P450
MFGRQAWLPGGFFAAWSIAAAGASVAAPGMIIPTSIAGAALAICLSRGHLASWLAPRPLPPGSMSFASGLRGLARRTFYLDGCAQWGPVFRSTQFGAPIICVVGMDRICHLMRNHAADLGPSPLVFLREISGSFLRYMDDEKHATYGGLIRRAMTDSIPSEAGERMKESCRTMLSSFSAETPSLPGPALRRLALESLGLLLFGFTGSDKRSRRFFDKAEELHLQGIESGPTRRARRLFATITDLVREQTDAPTDGIAGRDGVLARLRRLEPGMPDRVCLENLVLMHLVGTNNVSSLLRWILFHWSTQPEAVEMIRSRQGPERQHAAEAFFRESLRVGQSEYIYRKVTRDFVFEGFRFPRGWMVRACIWESHRLADGVPEASEFRPRLGAGDYDRRGFSPFGMGRHACNGGDVTSAVALALIHALAGGYDVLAERGEPFQHRMRHWSHWVPNDEMTVRITTPRRGQRQDQV